MLGGGGVQKAPPGGDYKKVSTLVPLPDFLPGLGTLYVDPATLPAGPFLAYDRSGKLVSTIYMIPLEDIEAHKKFDDLARSEEHTSELQSLMRIPYAVFCLKKKQNNHKL